MPLRAYRQKRPLVAALEFAQALDIPKITLVEEISRSKVAVAVDDDRSLRKATLQKEKLNRREISRVNEILSRIPSNLKENKSITSQSIFWGSRVFTFGHYAKVVRADLLIMNAENKNSSLWSRIFTKDLEHILSELPTDVLIVQNKEDE